MSHDGHCDGYDCPWFPPGGVEPESTRLVSNGAGIRRGRILATGPVQVADFRPALTVADRSTPGFVIRPDAAAGRFRLGLQTRNEGETTVRGKLPVAAHPRNFYGPVSTASHPRRSPLENPMGGGGVVAPASGASWSRAAAGRCAAARAPGARIRPIDSLRLSWSTASGRRERGSMRRRRQGRDE